MLKLLIADDEDATRERLRTQIDWESLYITLVASCKNGTEAYEQAKALRPDIIVTDINMPGMSGLDLIEKLEEEKLTAEYILLTGYADFSYAHRALTSRVHHYLLKPCDEQRLLDAVQECIRSLSLRRQIQKLPPLMEKELYGKEYSETVRLVLKYLETHYADQEISLKSIAQNELFMSPDYVGKQFSAQTGKRFVEYLQELRIRKAQWLLAGDVSPAQVATRVGYGENPQYFRKLFQNAVGMTPREYARFLHGQGDAGQKTKQN